MTCNIRSVPRVSVPDPLPLYSRDPETSSIRSAAPSYMSAAPSYRTTPSRHVSFSRPSPTEGLPTPRLAPGFRNRPLRGIPVSDIDAHSYNIQSWSSTNANHSRQYQSVANRRATVASAENERASMANALALQQEKLAPSSIEERNELLDPLEDPFVVGSAAAQEARQTRLRKEKEWGNKVLEDENKAWDFMISQMADWKAREKSWKQFRKEAEKPRLLGRRIGLLGSI